MLEIEIYEGITMDTLTQETCSKSVYVKSGMRHVYISINTIVKIVDLLRKAGFQI